MARSCGIRLGSRSFEVVVLDGGPKKAKLVAHVAGELPVGVEDPAAEAVAALKQAIAGLKLPADSIGLAVETGLAAFRSVKLPFADRDKIEEVIKFEVENQLPQWNIEDVIVDFLVLSSSAVESNLIVTAVPKESLAPKLATCERAGVEPVQAELESTAVLTAAQQAGLFDAESACVVVHLGDASTSVVVVDGGAVKSMRAIHSGAFPPVPTDDGGTAPDPEAHLEEVVVRLKRELRRAISGTATSRPIEAVYLCGHSAPGLAGEVILDVPVEELRVLPDDSAGDVEQPARYFAAWGAALRQLGAGFLRADLRREELRFLGKFERLELPLAVLGLLLLTLFSVRVIVTNKQLSRQEGDLRTWLQSSNLYMIGEPEKGKPGVLRRPPEQLRDYARNAEAGAVEQKTTKAQLDTIDRKLQDEILALQRKMGRDVSLTQPLSALEGVTLVLNQFRAMEESLGQFTIRSVDATYLPGKGSGQDRVLIKLDLTFRGDSSLDATNRFYSFNNALKQQPWFVEDRPVKEDTLETGDGIFLDNYQVTVDPKRANFTAEEGARS